MTLFIYFKRLIPLKRLLTFLTCLATGFSLYAQPTRPEIRPLTIGDTVPDIELHNIINYKSTTAKLSDFRGKLVIIDFWGTTCSSCIGALPGIQNLQNEFRDKLQVLTVTEFATKKQVLKILGRFHNTKNIKLPIVLSNKKLSQCFPHALLSHVVWIDRNGIVKAITGTEYITAQNIKTIYDGRSVDWPVKNDIFGFDYSQPLLTLTQKEKISSTLLYYSALAGHIDGIDATHTKDTANKRVIENYFNHSLLELCAGSLRGSGYGRIDPKKRILNVKDSDRFLIRGGKFREEWSAKNTYTYSITYPLGLTHEEVKKFIKKDLTKWLWILGINIKKEKRLRDCLLLVKIKPNAAHLLKTSGGKPEWWVDKPGGIKQLTNSSIYDLVWRLNHDVPGIPWVINETGIPKTLKIDMALKINNFKDISGIRKSLSKYGLDLVHGKRMMETFIITEH